MGNTVKIKSGALKISEAWERDDWLYGLTVPDPPLSKATVFRVMNAVVDAHALLGPPHLREDSFGLAVRLRRRKLQRLKPPARAQRLRRASRAVDTFLQWHFDPSRVSLLSCEAFSTFVRLPQTAVAVRDFVRSHGVFRRQDLVIGNDIPEFLQKFVQARRPSGQLPFALRLDTFWKESSEFKSVLQLHTAIREERWQDIKERWGVHEAEPLLEDRLNARLKNVRVGVRFDGRGAVPTLQTLFVLDGLYAHVSNQIAAKSPAGLCRRCGAAFVGLRPQKRFCTRRCEQADKQQRYRSRLANHAATHRRGAS